MAGDDIPVTWRARAPGATRILPAVRLLGFQREYWVDPRRLARRNPRRERCHRDDDDCDRRSYERHVDWDLFHVGKAQDEEPHGYDAQRETERDSNRTQPHTAREEHPDHLTRARAKRDANPDLSLALPHRERDNPVQPNRCQQQREGTPARNPGADLQYLVSLDTRQLLQREESAVVDRDVGNLRARQLSDRGNHRRPLDLRANEIRLLAPPRTSGGVDAIRSAGRDASRIEDPDYDRGPRTVRELPGRHVHPLADRISGTPEAPSEVAVDDDGHVAAAGRVGGHELAPAQHRDALEREVPGRRAFDGRLYHLLGPRSTATVRRVDPELAGREPGRLWHDPFDTGQSSHAIHHLANPLGLRLARAHSPLHAKLHPDEPVGEGLVPPATGLEERESNDHRDADEQRLRERDLREDEHALQTGAARGAGAGVLERGRDVEPRRVERRRQSEHDAGA